MTTTTPLIRRYERMDSTKRMAFLHSRVGEETDLSEDFILKVLPKERNPLAKWYLIKALGILRSVAGIPLIIEVCKEPEVDFGHTTLHAICAWSLGRAGEVALAPAMDLLNEENVETRRCAVDALGELRNPQAIEALCVSLERDERQVQLWAGLSLAKIGEAAIPCLRGILARGQLVTSLIALDALVKIGSHECLPILAQLLRSGSNEEKRFILEEASKFHEALVNEIKPIAESGTELSELAAKALAKL